MTETKPTEGSKGGPWHSEVRKKLGPKKIRNDFRHEVWCLKGTSVPVRFLEHSHICNMLLMVKKDPDNIWSGKTGKEWVEILNKELDYRTKAAESVFALFPKFYKEYKEILQKKFKV